MDTQSVKEAAWISRFIHILILAAVVAPGLVFRSHTLIAALTVAWFVVFAVIYLVVTRHR